MKVNSIQRDITLKYGNSGLRSKSENFREKSETGIKRGYNVDNCGSFTGKSKTAASFLDKILASNWFGNFTKYSQEHNISTSALIALVLAGIMRPATIMALPGKKDKEDKIYASGHAMASGIIGFIASTIVTSPFDESIKKVFDQKKFARGNFKKMDEEIAKLTKEKDAKTITEEAAKKLKSLTRKRDALNTLIKNIPDWVIGVPRAMLTIALIPPILKYVFGLEKKKKTMPNAQNPIQTPQMNFVDKEVFKSVKGANPSFGGAKVPNGSEIERALSDVAKDGSGFFEPLNRKYDQFTDKIAEHFTSRFVNWKPLSWLADKLKNTDNLFQHCMTVGSVVTSGLYMQRTLVNKDLDKDRRNTLAVNQGLTLIVSTAGAYALDKYIKGWWENVTARFAGHLLNDKDFYNNFLKDKEAIQNENKALLKNAKAGTKPELKSIPRVDKLVKKHDIYKAMSSEDAEVLMKKIKGMGLLRTMIVFGFVYRFFVPVVVTKPANKLCDMYLQKKKQKEQNTQKA